MHQCEAADCDRSSISAPPRLCGKHYARWKNHGTTDALRTRRAGTPSERFRQSYEVLENGCWRWTQKLTGNGYGRLRVNGRTIPAHVVSYEMAHGPIPNGQQVDHLCHTRDSGCYAGSACPHRACVNPDHLESVTGEENSRRMHKRAVNCPQGHPYDEANTYINPKGKKVCRECGRRATRVYQQKLKAKTILTAT